MIAGTILQRLRMLRLLWLGILTIVSLACSSATPTPTVTNLPERTSTPIPQAGFSSQALELLSAYHELVSFKDEPWFHVFCYSNNGPAARWANHVNSIDTNTFLETGIAPGELWGIGFDYCQNEGVATEYIVSTQKQMEPEWVNHRPIPTPNPEFAIPGRPYKDLSERLGNCIWNNASMWHLFPELMLDADNATELTAVFEAALESATDKETVDGALNALLSCESTR